MNDDMQAHVLELGRRWAEAEPGGDVETLGGLLADDFVLVGPLGLCSTSSSTSDRAARAT